jgi:ABC-type phosphate/phosphonate transport system substrate-binding protein
MRRGIVGCVAVLALAASWVWWVRSGPAEERGSGRTVRIGLIGSLFRDTPEPVVLVMMRPFRSLLETQTGVCGDLIAAGDANNLAQKLKNDEVQLGVFHGIEFAWARQKFPRLRALVIAINQHPFLRAELIVKKDSVVSSLADLKGRIVALDRRAREHCHLYLERRCVPPGATLQKHFSRLATPLNAEDSLDDLDEGAVQAAVVDATDFESYKEKHPVRAARLRRLDQSEQFPCAVVAYYPGSVQEDLLDRFRSGMIAAQDTSRGKQLLSLCRITRFEEPPDEYEAALSAILKAYPPAAPGLK